MAAKIHELRAKLGALIEEANTAFETVRALATEESREITADERKAQDAFDVRIATLKTEYDDEATKNSRLAILGSATPDEPIPGSGPQAVAEGIHTRVEDDPARGFASHREFFMACMEFSGLRDRADVDHEGLASLAVHDGTEARKERCAVLYE